MGESLLTALALVLIVEGLLPFASPVQWRRVFEELLKMQDGTQTEGNCIHCNRCMVSIWSGSRCVVDNPNPIVASAPIT